MAGAPTITQINTETKTLLQATASTDPPFDSSQYLDAHNYAYQQVWMESGGRLKKVASGTAWSSATTTTSGVMTGILDSIEEILQAWWTASAGSTGGTEGTDFVIRETEKAEINFWRGRNAGSGSYGTIQMYSVDRLQTATDADKNKMVLDFWPAIASVYIPIHYVPQFVPFSAIDSTIPELDDAQARCVSLISAIRLAPLEARWDFLEGYFRELAMLNKPLAERIARAQDFAKQNRVP